MRTRASLVLVVVAAAAVWVAGALAADPAHIYNDYVRQGHLKCTYSRGDLERLLRSGSINQYGDPLTLARLKLAARKQLAGSCRTASPSAGGSTTGTTSGTGTPTGSNQQGAKGHKKPKSPSAIPTRPSSPTNSVRASVGGGNGPFIAGRLLLIGLVPVALAFAGWLTKRGLGTRD
jgi:hypothetical protein